MPCPYANSLGVPGEGVHSTTIGGIARNDVIGTVGLGILTTYNTGIPYYYTVPAWFVAGEVAHYVFGVQTRFLTAVGITVPTCEG